MVEGGGAVGVVCVACVVSGADARVVQANPTLQVAWRGSWDQPTSQALSHTSSEERQACYKGNLAREGRRVFRRLLALNVTTAAAAALPTMALCHPRLPMQLSSYPQQHQHAQQLRPSLRAAQRGVRRSMRQVTRASGERNTRTSADIATWANPQLSGPPVCARGDQHSALLALSWGTPRRCWWRWWWWCLF